MQLSKTTRAVKSSSIETIKKLLLKNAEGVFIWIRLAMDELVQAIQEGESDEGLESISQELPPGLTALYERALQHAIQGWELVVGTEVVIVVSQYRPPCCLLLVSTLSPGNGLQPIILGYLFLMLPLSP